MQKGLEGEHEFDSNKETIEDTVVITEGEMDVLAIAEGFQETTT